ncbi:MAG: hypothetical protein M1826_000581 [Phylliscum demangeonii]|nr:MAG: hypothetical protein M1826_000581 [Phylliscum demangeonii]
MPLLKGLFINVYTCQKPKGEQCKFFLWEDDAKLRSAMVVLNASRSEAEHMQAACHPPSLAAEHEREDGPHSPPPPYSVQDMGAKSATGTANRRSSSEEEVYDWPLTGEEEMQASQLADRVVAATAAVGHTSLPTARAIPETPRKATKTDRHDSPRKRPLSPSPSPSSSRTMNEWSTPRTTMQTAALTPRTTEHRPGTASVERARERTERDIFATPTLKRTMMDGATPSSDGRPWQLPSPSVTPTPSRFRDVPLTGLSGHSALAEEVLAALEKKAALDEATRSEVASICNRHALKSQGIAKGRDISRLAIKAKEVKIAELEYRAASLEAEKETNTATIRTLKRQLDDVRRGLAD